MKEHGKGEETGARHCAGAVGWAATANTFRRELGGSETSALVTSYTRTALGSETGHAPAPAEPRGENLTFNLVILPLKDGTSTISGESIP